MKSIVCTSIVLSLVAPSTSMAQRDIGTMMGGNKIEHEYGSRSNAEARAALVRELEELSERAWKKRATSWIALERSKATTDEGLELLVGKGVWAASTKRRDWDVAEKGRVWFLPLVGRKVPKQLRLILGNPSRSEIECALREPVAKTPKGRATVLGVFLRADGGLSCVSRHGEAFLRDE